MNDFRNEVWLSGEVVHTTGLRQSKSGDTFWCSVIILAKNGEKDVAYVPCVAFNEVAEKVASFKEGDFIKVSGVMLTKNKETKVKVRLVLKNGSEGNTTTGESPF